MPAFEVGALEIKDFQSSNVQPKSPRLTTLAGLQPQNGYAIIGNGTDWDTAPILEAFDSFGSMAYQNEFEVNISGGVVAGIRLTVADPDAVRNHLGAAPFQHGHTNATQLNAGFLSATDKLKLDGIVSDAAAGTASLRSLGAGANQAAAGNHSHSLASLGAASVTHTHNNATSSVAGFMSATDKAKLDGISSDAAAATASLRSLGAGATQAAAGNHSHSVDAAANVGSFRTLGAGATQAAAGNHSHSLSSLGAASVTHIHNNATSSVAGFMSAADKSKLDNISSDATAGVASLRTLGSGAQQAAAGNHSHNTFIPAYTSPPGVPGSGGAAIFNDSSLYQALVIFGNTSAPDSSGLRNIELYDRVSIAADLTVGGNVFARNFDSTISDSVQINNSTTRHTRQINASGLGTASGNWSQINASYSCSSSSPLSQINSSQSCSITTPNGWGQINNSISCNIPSGINNFITSSNNCDVAGASQAGIICGIGVINNNSLSIAGGNGSGKTTANRKWELHSANGTIKASGAISGGSVFADYAELFPNAEGVEIPLGTIVTLDGYGCRIAQMGDRILGVVSATAGIVLGDTPFCWQGRYLRGDFGELIYEQILDPNWQPAEGQTESTRPLILIPKENPDWNSELEQIPRSQRPDEWTTVGLLGQIYARCDRSVKPMNYIMPVNGIGTTSDTPTKLQVMEISSLYLLEKGYAVARCLLQ